MKIAEILSDLASLRVCDHDAALALVTTNKPPLTQVNTRSKPNSINFTQSSLLRHTSILAEEARDPDLQRVRDLVALHYGVKECHMQGKDMGLEKARLDVQRAVEIGPKHH